MALPPTIPTSFVPRPSSAAVRRRSDLTGAFAFLGYGVLAIVIALSIGAFIYSQILSTERTSKDQELQKQIAAIDPATVSKFVHLRDRLAQGLVLLNQHIATTGFWNDLIGIMPSTVQFTALHILRDQTGTVTVQGTGVAKSFNALAATSDAFAKDGRIKDAIFSSIRVNSGAVSFSLTATIDPTLVSFSPAAQGVSQPQSLPPPATTTAQ